MYRKNDSTWLKHWDFIILDLVMFQAAYVISYMIRMGLHNPYRDKLYLTIGVVICLADICVAFLQSRIMVLCAEDISLNSTMYCGMCSLLRFWKCVICS